jgi:hypothetical protein
MHFDGLVLKSNRALIKISSTRPQKIIPAKGRDFIPAQSSQSKSKSLMSTQLILGIFFLIVTILPLVYFGRLATRRPLKAKKALTLLAQEKGLELDELDYWNDKAIGLDLGKKSLLFVSLQENNYNMHVIALRHIRGCSVSEGKESIGLALEAKQAEGGIASVHIILFDRAFDQLGEEGFHRKLAIKWNKRIGQVLRDKPAKAKKSA